MKSNEIINNQIKDEIKSNEIKSDEIKDETNEIKSNIVEFKSDGVIYMVVHPFGYEEDNVLRHYPDDTNIGIPIKKHKYEQILNKFTKKLKPLQVIQNIIDYEKQNLFKEDRLRLGVHIRRTDLKSKCSENYIIEMLQSWYLPNYHNWDIFICSDDLAFQNKLRYTFNNYHIKTYNDPHKTKNNIIGTQKAIVDLYLLSHCHYILATKDSSFGYYAWILSDNNTSYEVFC